MNVLLLYSCISLFGLMSGFFNSLPQDFLNSSLKSNVINSSAEYSDKPTIKTTLVNFGEFKLVVKTTIIYDSLLSCNLVLNNKVISQQLHFYKNNSETSNYKFDPRKVEVSMLHIKKCKVFENIITEISVLQGRNGWIYEISGSGITGNQTEYTGLLTPEGHLIYYSYSASRNKNVRGVPNEQKGDLNTTLKKYGIEMNLFLHPRNITIVDY